MLVEGPTGDRHAQPAKAAEALLALAECAPPEGLSASAWREVADMPESSFYRVRKWLIDNHKIANIGTPRMPRYVVRAEAA